MDNLERLNKLMQEAEIYSTGFYKNDANTYMRFSAYINELNKLKSSTDNEMLNQIVINICMAYQQQNVIWLADLLVGPLKDFLCQALQIKNNTDKSQDNNTASIVGDEWFKKNVHVIPRLKKSLYTEFNNILDKYDSEDETISMDLKRNTAVLRENSWWYLNSTVDSKRAAKLWAEEIKDINEGDCLVVCGISNGDYIRQLMKVVPDNNIIIVYEPDKRIFETNLIYTDFSDIIKKDNVFLLVEDINIKELYELLMSAINYNTIKQTKFYALPGYDVAYADEIMKFMEKCKKAFVDMIMLNNTIVLKNKDINFNVIMNLQFVMNDSNIELLRQSFEKEHVTEAPAIIVAAGPSLDKNIKDLKAAKNRAFIIATDSSLRMLTANDIMPDIVVTLDPNKERILFSDDRVNDLPIAYCIHATNDILLKNRGRKFLYSNMSFVNTICKKFNKNPGTIDPGGSVANAGFAVARYLGFNTTIMIGQDLAFTNNKKHASVVYDDKGICDTEKNMYTTIEGVNGEELLTYINFKTYRDWYERKIEYDKELVFVNATEGGARIHGALEMTLKDAINKYCSTEIDFGKVISSCENTFSEEEKKEFIAIIKGYIKEADEVYNMSGKLESNYERICNDKNLDNVKALMTKCEKIIKKLDKSVIMEFVSYFARLDEMQTTDGLTDIDREKENAFMSTQDEIKQIGVKGKNLALSYKKNTKRTKELFENSYNVLLDSIKASAIAKSKGSSISME